MQAEQALKFAKALEPSLQRAFLKAVSTLKSDVSIRRLERAVGAGDVDAIVAALSLSAGVLTPLTEAMRAVYISTGELTLRTINQPRGRKLSIRFNGSNPNAQEYLTDRSGVKIAEILDDQRLVIRQSLERGLAAGRNPRSTALDLVGRIKDGKRTGGVIGLTSRQSQHVQNMRDELSDPAKASSYFQRSRRDARFDSVVRRAISDGKPVAIADIDRISGRYSDRLLQLRGETIARTETLGAMNAASQEAMSQLVTSEGLERKDVQKIWRASEDERTRESHAALNGEYVKFDEAFVTITGVRLMRPADPSAPAEEVINCRCWVEHRVDWAGMANG